MENHDKELDNLSESFLKFDSVLEIESYLRRIAENICHMQPQRQSDLCIVQDQSCEIQSQKL